MAALRSGMNNEVHSEFISLLENLLEQRESAEEDMADKAETTTKLNSKKALEAEVLWLSAMNSAAGRKRLLELQEEPACLSGIRLLVQRNNCRCFCLVVVDIIIISTSIDLPYVPTTHTSHRYVIKLRQPPTTTLKTNHEFSFPE